MKNKKKHWYTTCLGKTRDLYDVYETEETTCLICLRMILTDLYIPEEHPEAKKRLKILKYRQEFEDLISDKNKLDNDNKKE